MSDDIANAKREVRRARFMSWFWWGQMPVVVGVYWIISTEASVEKAILCYLAAVSIIANAVTYSGKAKAAEAVQITHEKGGD